MPPPTEKRKRSLAQTARARLATLMTFLPHIPFVLRLMVAHVLKRSESSKYLDLRSVVLVQVLHRLVDVPPEKSMPMSKLQAMTTRDPGVKGRIWISQVASSIPPETSIRDVLLDAIESSKHDLVPSVAKCRAPNIARVEAEWTGYRADATPKSPLPAISEEEKYHEMMKGCKGSTTVLYFHGGAYYLCDPVSHRQGTKKIAKLTGGRVYSVRYRLAPQHPFPSALLDALVSYLTLLYPPPGAIHEAVSPANIVFAGDSAGGNLSLALLQTVLQIRRMDKRITWFGEEREVPLPAAVAAISPWLDVVQSLPSWRRNQPWDYLPPPNVMDHPFPADDIWPPTVPRRHVFIDDDYLLHPCASLQLAASWVGSPPIHISCGWECLADEDKWLAKKLTEDGVTVVFEEYEAMPHVFGMILSHLPESRRWFEGLANFMKAATEDPAGIKPAYRTIQAKTLKEVELQVEKLSPYTPEDLRKLAYKAIVLDANVAAAKL